MRPRAYTNPANSKNKLPNGTILKLKYGDNN